MIKFEHTEVMGIEHAIRGMRNPMNSWHKSDSQHGCFDDFCEDCDVYKSDSCSTNNPIYILGDNDITLAKSLRNAGSDHRKFMRFIQVYVDITAPLYWWKEFDTYRMGVEKNSCSTMHTIHKKDLTMDDFSFEDLSSSWTNVDIMNFDPGDIEVLNPRKIAEETIKTLNLLRKLYMKTKNKQYWRMMIQLLPTPLNQKRTVMISYEALINMYTNRKVHKLDEWSSDNNSFKTWVEELPYSFLITGGENNERE